MTRDSTDTGAFDWRDPLLALALLSRLPLPGWVHATAARRGGRIAWAFPLVGLALGVLAAGLAQLAVQIGLSAPAAAGLALAGMAMMTGGLHLDGLADCADGVWGGQTPVRRLEIMADSRIGTYGVVALILVLGLQWIALAELIARGAGWAGALIGAAMLARAAMVAVMRALPAARPGGLAAGLGAVPWSQVAVAVSLAMVAAVLLLPLLAALIAVLAAMLATLALAAVARRKIGGMTGDVLGAAQECATLAALLALSAL